MLGPEMNVGLDAAGPIQKMCGAGSVPGPDLGKILTSLGGRAKASGLVEAQEGPVKRKHTTRKK